MSKSYFAENRQESKGASANVKKRPEENPPLRGENTFRRAPEDARLPDLLLRVAGAYQKAGNAAGRDALIARLHAQHPDSEAARTAAIISH